LGAVKHKFNLFFQTISTMQSFPIGDNASAIK